MAARTDESADAHTDGSADGAADAHTDGFADARMDGSADGAADAHTDGFADARMDGSADGAADARIDGSANARMDGSTHGSADFYMINPGEGPAILAFASAEARQAFAMHESPEVQALNAIEAAIDVCQHNRIRTLCRACGAAGDVDTAAGAAAGGEEALARPPTPAPPLVVTGGAAGGVDAAAAATAMDQTRDPTAEPPKKKSKQEEKIAKQEIEIRNLKCEIVQHQLLYLFAQKKQNQLQLELNMETMMSKTRLDKVKQLMLNEYETEQQQKCCVCLERQKSVAMTCGHLVCKECSKEFLPGKLPCPLCRRPVQGQMTIYL